MPKYERVDQATFREENAEELARKEEKRLKDFVHALETQPIEMDMSKETEESANLGDYTRDAHKGLKAILARAARDEVEDHGS